MAAGGAETGRGHFREGALGAEDKRCDPGPADAGAGRRGTTDARGAFCAGQQCGVSERVTATWPRREWGGPEGAWAGRGLEGPRGTGRPTSGCSHGAPDPTGLRVLKAHLSFLS